MVRQNGFSLIELLVVIGIIGILAAIIFPVFARAKDSAYRSSDMARMNEIRSSLQLYREDQGAYPPALLGYATLYTSGPEAGNLVPADKLIGKLYPKRISSLDTLRAARNKNGGNTYVNPVWPAQDARAVGTAPILDLDGNGIVNSADDIAGARQLYGLTDQVMRIRPEVYSVGNWTEMVDAGTETDPEWFAYYYKVSGYDVGFIPTEGGGERWELRYSLFWTDYALNGGNILDDPRQLGYTNPPDSTVITWNSWFREYENGEPVGGKREIVLFLGGNARMADSRDVKAKSWRVMP